MQPKRLVVCIARKALADRGATGVLRQLSPVQLRGSARLNRSPACCQFVQAHRVGSRPAAQRCRLRNRSSSCDSAASLAGCRARPASIRAELPTHTHSTAAADLHPEPAYLTAGAPAMPGARFGVLAVPCMAHTALIGSEFINSAQMSSERG